MREKLGGGRGSRAHHPASASRLTAPGVRACSNTPVDEVDAVGRCGTRVSALLKGREVAFVRLAVVVDGRPLRAVRAARDAPVAGPRISEICQGVVA